LVLNRGFLDFEQIKADKKDQEKYREELQDWWGRNGVTRMEGGEGEWPLILKLSGKVVLSTERIGRRLNREGRKKTPSENEGGGVRRRLSFADKYQTRKESWKENPFY